jgi:hypothetical protein
MVERVEMKQFCFEHLDLFAWRDDDFKTYQIRSELMDGLIHAVEKGECWTAVKDGRILVIGGVVPQTKKTGLCFTLFSRYADENKIAAARSVRQMFKGILEEFDLHRVVTYNRVGATNHHKWVEWLGFKFEAEVAKFDDEGNNYFQYALTR